MASLMRSIFGIGTENVRFDKRGFRLGRPETRDRLEHVGETFLAGYHAALEQSREDRIAERLELVKPADRGFAFEGAAMALALRDKLLPGSRSLQALMRGHGSRHIYMLHVGAGWALARLPWKPNIENAIQGFDPLLRGLVVDGYGFHEGYFRWCGNEPPAPPNGLSREGLHAFDQGLGRSLWFKQCGDPEAIACVIRDFPDARQRDLWGGVGLAAAYAGVVPRADLLRLQALANHPAALSQGAVFAAKARELAGNPASHTGLACSVFCRTSARLAAQIADQALEDLLSGDAKPRYQDWVLSVERRLGPSSRTSSCPEETETACG